MIGRAIRMVVALFGITLIWGYANALGATQAVNQATGLNIPTNFKIPYVDQQWAMGQKEIPHPSVIARETIREAGRQDVIGMYLRGLSDAATYGQEQLDDWLEAYKEGAEVADSRARRGDFGFTDEDTARFAAALADAQALTVQGRAPRTGYSRSEFGSGWATVDGCDMRNRILQRDLHSVTFQSGSDCVVASGVLEDPFTGTRINFARGADTSSAVQIDHVVALSDAWQKGAQQWSAEKRREFSNDPLNLLAVDGPQNQAKSDSDAATWLPPNKQFRCEFVSIQVDVKTKYDVWVTQAEQDAIVRILEPCAEG